MIETLRVDGRPALSISSPGRLFDAHQRMELIDPEIRPDAAGKMMRADFELAIAFQLAACAGVELQIHDDAPGTTAFRFILDLTAPPA